MQRVRIRYTKEGRARFVSARDLTAVWERALRRAEVPIAYSEGYTPHAKVSFPDALPVGYASTGEYAELTFATPIDPGPALGRCSATLPEGMTITTYLDVPDGAPKLARMLRVTCWELVYPATDQAAGVLDELRRLGERLRAADHVEVTRHRPDGDRVLDVAPAIIDLNATTRREERPDGAGVETAPVLRAVLRNDGPTIRPTDLHTALTVLLDPEPPGSRRRAEPAGPATPSLPEPVRYRRVAQGEPTDGGLTEALSGAFVGVDPDRLAGAA